MPDLELHSYYLHRHWYLQRATLQYQHSGNQVALDSHLLHLLPNPQYWRLWTYSLTSPLTASDPRVSFVQTNERSTHKLSLSRTWVSFTRNLKLGQNLIDNFQVLVSELDIGRFGILLDPSRIR